MPRVVRLTTLAELDACEAAWRTLDARVGGPMEQFDWVRSCAATLGTGQQLNITTVWRGDRLVAVAPMQIAPRGGVRRASLIGVERHYEPMDLLYEDEAALAVLVDEFVFGRQSVRTKVLTVAREDGPLDVASGRTARAWQDDPFALEEIADG